MRVRLAVTTVLSALTSTALGAAPAHAAGAEVDLLWTVLVARGAAVDVAYGIDCPAGYSGTVTFSLAQVRGDGLRAGGTAVADLVCGGTGLPDTQRVTASITGAPFTRGRATLAMQVVACDDQDCFSTPVNRTTRLTNLP